MPYSSIGANNGQAMSVDGLDLIMTNYSQDVIKYFNNYNVFEPLVTVETISSGDGKSFPILGNASSALYTNETDTNELVPAANVATERIISIEGRRTSFKYLGALDAAMAVYDAKNATIEAIGREQAVKIDSLLCNTVIAAGNIVDATTSLAAGLKPFSEDKFSVKVTIPLNKITDGGELLKAIAAADTILSNNEIVGDAVVVARPSVYNSFLSNESQTQLNWVNDEYTMSGRLPTILGKKIYKSARFPAFTGTLGVPAVGNVLMTVFTKDAVGLLKLLALEFSANQIPHRQMSWLLQASQAVGAGVLNHACAVNIVIGAAV